MTNFKLRGVLAAVAGTLVLGMATSATADATFDLVDALVKKGVLTEEEALPLLQGRENDIKTADKKVKKASRVTVSDAIENATIYGDIRVRYEDRSGAGNGVATGSPAVVSQTEQARQRARYKITLGVKTESGKWYSDLALAMGANGRSDNATFGKSATANLDDKEALFVKRAMVGYKATEWLALEAGRMNNPLYTTPMVWDADLNFEGLVEKVNYKLDNNTDLFFTAAQVQYQGDRRDFTTQVTGQADTITTELFAFQGGGKYAFNDHTNAKAGLTYTTYSHNTSNTKFSPKLATDANATVTGVGAGVNDLDTIEIPAEINYYMNSNSIGIKLFGDYVYNTSGDDRFNAAVAAQAAGTARNTMQNAGNDDTAWLLGLAVGSAADFKSFDSNKMVKGDWSARVWYQDVGAYSVDPNAVDSDFMDSRVNTKGTVLKAQYNLEDNVYLNFAYGHAERKNKALGTAGAAQDLALNWKDYDLFQLDLTYKF